MDLRPGMAARMMPAMPPLDPLVSEFASSEEEAAYDIWFRAEVQASLDDPRPTVPHDEAMAMLNQRMKDRRAEAELDHPRARRA